MGTQAASMLSLLVISLIGAAVADITHTTVHSGDCVCATTTVNARSAAGTSASIVTSMSSGDCGKIHGGILTKDGYKWYELDFHGSRVWVAGNYLRTGSGCGTSSGSVSTGTCSSEQKSKACTVLNLANQGKIDLAKRHPSGVNDNAYAYNNIVDMCNGHQASRSSY